MLDRYKVMVKDDGNFGPTTVEKAISCVSPLSSFWVLDCFHISKFGIMGWHGD